MVGLHNRTTPFLGVTDADKREASCKTPEGLPVFIKGNKYYIYTVLFPFLIQAGNLQQLIMACRTPARTKHDDGVLAFDIG